MSKRINPHSDHPHWKRYLNMTHRARQSAAVLSPHKHMTVSTVGIDPRWAPQKDYRGFLNFVKWIEAELKKHPELRGGEILIRRKNRMAPYGPDSCRIVAAIPRTRKPVLEKPTKAEVRFKSEEVGSGLLQMEYLFGIRSAFMSTKPTHKSEITRQLFTNIDK